MAAQSNHLDDLSATLKGVIQKSLLKSGKINLSEEPKIEKKDIIEYDRRMRASGLEKFNGPAYSTGISFYKTQKDLEVHNACGALIIHISEDFMENFLKALGHSGLDDAPEEDLAQKCGEYCQQIAEQFTSEISSLGYNNLVLSPVDAARNSLPQGLYFSYDQYEKADVIFFLKATKVLVAEISMTAKK